MALATALPYPLPNAVYPPQTRRNGPSGRASKRADRGRAGQRGAHCCAWCGRKLAGQHLLTCGPSCRSQLSRAKRRSCARLLTDGLGMPRDVAERLLKAVGLPEVEIRLNALGWHWQARGRAWEREAQRRAA